MATLTNNYQNCQLLNLGYGPNGRGPFVVRQEGSVPGSMTLENETFLLRKDGAWVLNLAVFALSEKDKEQFLYENSGEAVQLLDGLVGEPAVESKLPPGQSVEQLKSKAQSTFTGIWGRIRNAKA